MHHGQHGPLQIDFASKWEPVVPAFLDILQDAGVPLNPDMNSGDPIGAGIAPNTAVKGVRSTAADMLEAAPENFEIRTTSQVSKILFDGKKAVGIVSGDERIYARHEVILSCGALDTPKLLMLSGIGPVEHLRSHGIPVTTNLEAIGQNLQDHLSLSLTWERADHTSPRKEFYQSPERQAAAKVEWERTKTGPLADIGTTFGLGWLKSEHVLKSKEFEELPTEHRLHLLRPTVPTFEMLFNPGNVDYFIDAANTPVLFSAGVTILNPASAGTVRLQSANSEDSALFDPNLFSHAYDKRVAIEATRDLLKRAKHPDFVKDTIRLISGPESDSEDGILEHWRNASSTIWHMAGTCKMGRPESEKACVDLDFCVLGTTNLRVVDMSVVPIQPK